MPNVRRALALPILIAGLTIVSACGSSGSTAKGAATNSTPKSVASAGSSGSSGGNVHLTGSFCDMAKQFTSTKNGIFSDSTSTDPTVQLKNLKQGFANASDALNQLDAKAPAAIKADVDYVVQQFETVNAQVQKLTAYDATQLSKVTSSLDSPEAQKHSNSLDAYTKSKCGIDPNAGASAS